ncbi:uncharacterized protein LOC119991491 [Tripterygium wilfordii]|uniref:uncharacterized protein LOC119991491 n=1 Tax=Tripterygium wilfordii TaxID=458696 RepID=UPI0018F82F68|nr:uncharacterized protein LOC119991491 [Tripterygium wilfordii]
MATVRSELGDGGRGSQSRNSHEEPRDDAHPNPGVDPIQVDQVARGTLPTEDQVEAEIRRTTEYLESLRQGLAEVRRKGKRPHESPPREADERALRRRAGSHSRQGHSPPRHSYTRREYERQSPERVSRRREEHGDDRHSHHADSRPREIKHRDEKPVKYSDEPDAMKGDLIYGAQQRAMKALDEMTTSPFTRDIRKREVPRRLVMPTFEQFNGRTDPVAHLDQFMRKMILWEGDEPILCKVFPSSLGTMASRWFHQLPPNSISSWREMAKLFINRFIAGSREPKTLSTLLTMKPNSGEEISDYLSRYLEVCAEVDGCDERTTATSFKIGLPDGCKLKESLTLYEPNTIATLQDRVRRYAKVEVPKAKRMSSPKKEEKGSRNSRSVQDDKKSSSRAEHSRSGKSSANAVEFNMPIHKLFYEIRDQPFIVRPPKMSGDPDRRDKKRYCAFHRDVGHMTGECNNLREHLEELARQGKLAKYVKNKAKDGNKTRDNVGRSAACRGQDDNDEPKGTINVIILERQGHVVSVNNTIAQTKMAEGQEAKKRRTGIDITFSDRDLAGLDPAHNDALKITIRVCGYDVKRVLIDQGSAVNIMYYPMFEKLGLSQADLVPETACLVGFNGSQVYPLGRIRTRVRLGPKTLDTEFLVVQGRTANNAILGRPWLHAMEAVPSTYHQTLRFPYNGNMYNVKGDRPEWNSVVASPRTTKETHQIGTFVEETLVEPEPGLDPEKKSIEQLEKIQIDGSNIDKYFLIGKNLPAAERESLLGLLMRNIGVFAWTPQEMPGVDRKVASHRLNIRPDSKPVIQKARRSALAHAEAVVKEVEKLTEAGAIREVDYPEWLSNTVVVKKKNGTWRVCVDFTDLNKSCPKDLFPLPKIDQLVDSTSGSQRMSFLDAYRGYHQIPMNEEDEEKTAFITPRGTYCYKVMPFGLKNAGATYQRLVTKMFGGMIGRTVEVYIDDMVVKTAREDDHLSDLQSVFDVLDVYKLKLNASKCAFGVSSGKFLGHLVTRRGIEADPDQIAAIRNLRSPSSVKEVQKLTGMAAALNRFISKSSDRCHHFFRSLRGAKKFEWDSECEMALAELKDYLQSVPLLSTPVPGEKLRLYLAVSEVAVSAVLLRVERKIEQPIYYVSKTLLGAETRYTPLEKLLYCLVIASRKLNHYFHDHSIEVATAYPLRSVLSRADLSGRIAKWAVELGQHDIHFVPRTAIKGQVVADFIAEFSSPPEQPVEEVWTLEINPGSTWELMVDGSSTRKGSGAGVVLTSPEGLTIEQAIRLGFDATNNESEYEALLCGLRSALKLGAKRVKISSDSQLIVGQLTGEYAAKTKAMIAYLTEAKKLIEKLEDFEIQQVPRGQNSHADALATLASADQEKLRRTIIIDIQEKPSVPPEQVEVSQAELGPSWMDPLVGFLKDGSLPEDKKEARKVTMKSSHFWLSPEDKLYRRSFTGPYLLCVHPKKKDQLLYEIHEGSCGSHTGGRSMAQRAISQGYWWPQMHEDSKAYARSCEKCQKFSNIPRQPATELSPLTSPWPFSQWGLDLVGPLPRATGDRKWLITATDYFTKWIEAKPLAKITDSETKKFVWESIITRFGIPYVLVSDNGTQFDSKAFRDFCNGYGIRNKYSTPAYPQGNGQAEASNKIVLDGLKKRLDSAKGRWVEELPSVLWTQRTTPRRSTGQTPFSLAYGMEAVIPLEIGLPSIRTLALERGENDNALAVSLDLLEEKREQAALKLASYQHELAKVHDRKVRARNFHPGDLVLRKVLGSTKNPQDGKLGANWEGPYKIVSISGPGAYKIEDLVGKTVQRPWNAVNLRKFYA